MMLNWVTAYQTKLTKMKSGNKPDQDGQDPEIFRYQA